MRVLHVISSLSRDQGGLRATLEGMCAALSTAGAQCAVAAVGSGEGVPHAETLRFKPSAPRRLSASYELKDWLYTHARDFDALIAHGIWLSPTRYAFHAARRAGRSFLLRPAGMLDPDALAHHPVRKKLFWWLGEKGVVTRSHLLFSTDEDRARAASSLKLAVKHCHVLSNPVRTEFFEAPARAASKSPPLILCLNRLHPRKGVREFVEALLLLEKSHAFSAIHAGPEEDGDYARACRDLAARLVEKGNLSFAGALDSARVRELLSQADILVHPATGYENFGMVIAEAMAAGVAVVASRRALITSQLEREKLAEAVEPDGRAIARALAKLIDSALGRKEMAERGQRYARANFAPQVVGVKLVQLLKSIGP